MSQRVPSVVCHLSTGNWTSTKVYVRKNKLFLQNEPKFRKSQMNVSYILTKDYEKIDTWLSGKNEPKTNPIKANIMPKRTQNKANFI